MSSPLPVTRIPRYCFAVGAAAVIALASCSPVRQIQPLKKNESAVTLSAGGPFTGQLGWAPIPMLSVGYNRGLIDTVLDIEAGWCIMSALYGVMHLDIGANWRPFLSNRLRPGLMVSTKVFLLTDFGPDDFRAYPDLGLTAFWKLPRPSWYVYTGIESWFELHDKRTDGNEQVYHWLPAPYVGLDMGHKKWQFQFEARLYTPNADNTGRATENAGIGAHGLWGVMLGVKRTFVPRGN